MSVMVFIEQRERKIENVSLELLGKGKELAQKLNQKLVGVVIGNEVAELANEAIHYGAEEVVVVDNKMLETYVTETYTKALTEAIKAKNPDVVLVGATTIGRDLAPRVSARIHTGLTADCTMLDIDDATQNLLMTRPAFGGNIMATIICPDFKPQMSTVRPGVMKKLEKNTELTGTIENLNVLFEAKDLNVNVLEFIKETVKSANIEDSDILVSVGRGIGDKENIELAHELAELLGGEVSASRAVIDAGMIDKARQVGQTGKTVRPNVYIACGISGAIQHLAGMEESELIIAINKNPNAPIFEVADVGIVGDAKKVLTELIENLKSSK